MILIHKATPFQILKVISDKSGGYLFVQGSLIDNTITLVNVYGPNSDIFFYLFVNFGIPT